MKISKAVSICFVGIDGSGKGTLMKKISDHYGMNMNIKQKLIYFGWSPFLPSTKWISKRLEEKDYKINRPVKKKVSFLQEIALIYMIIEYSARYIFQIVPFTYMKRIILIDRYIYDIFVQNDYASRRKWFINALQVFPQPDFTFFLDIGPEQAYQRKPELSRELLEKHRAKYNYLYKRLPLRRIDTAQSIEACIKEIDNHTKKLMRQKFT